MMAQRMGMADLPLHYGRVPLWLAKRMTQLGGAITEAILQEYGSSALLSRLSNPCWFQALGCVLGMDWHSSGITTSVMGALKKAIQPHSREWGLSICGGRGKYSRLTPTELLQWAEITGLDGQHLVHCSRLTAKVDNAVIQDGFQLYLHNFVVTQNGEWAVIQQGMNGETRHARRYHWHSSQVRSFVEEPHSHIYGHNLGKILNLTHREAALTRERLVQLTSEMPIEALLKEINHLVMPVHHAVRKKDVNQKRLGAVLAMAHDVHPADFTSLMMLKGVGARTLQSLTLVSEVIHGTPSRFDDPARFSFAHGGKDGHPFPVPTQVYDETIAEIKSVLEKSHMASNDKRQSLKKLHEMTLQVEKEFIPNDRFDEWIQKERDESYRYGGRTVMGKAQPPFQHSHPKQLKLF